MRNVMRDPDLKLDALSLWVHGRQFPNHSDYWDGNWLRVTARVETSGAVVETTGSFIHSSELQAFISEVETLDRSLSGTAELYCMEPNLRVVIECASGGHATVTVNITHDHMTQKHEFLFQIDQTYFKPVIAGGKRILETYPIVGSRDQPQRIPWWRRFARK